LPSHASQNKFRRIDFTVFFVEYAILIRIQNVALTRRKGGGRDGGTEGGTRASQKKKDADKISSNLKADQELKAHGPEHCIRATPQTLVA